jgi:hypothetical protein
MAPLTVACVKWGDKYGHEYVTKLRNACARNLLRPEFVCFTDDPVPGVDCRELPSDLPSWWSKIGLFKPGTFAGNVLYLDLDVVITGRLDGLVSLLTQDRGRLWALDDFSYSLVTPKRTMAADTRRLLGGDGTINSSVMMWHGDACREVWDRFDPSVMDVLHGDQNYITQCLWPRINLIPKTWASSYKYGGDGVIRVFHGEPKPPQVADEWVRLCWR